MRASTFSAPFLACLVATPICLLLALASGGSGHGNYFLAKILFPYTMLSTLVFESITMPFVILVIIQLRLYGIELGLANRREIFGYATIGLSVVHLLTVIIELLIPNGNFS